MAELLIPQQRLRGRIPRYIEAAATPDSFGAGAARGERAAGQLETEAGGAVTRAGQMVEEGGRIVQRTGAIEQGVGNILGGAARQRYQNTGETLKQANAAGKLADVAFRWQDRLDEASAREADNLLATKVRERLYSSEDAYYKKKGKNAIEAYDTTLSTLREDIEQVSRDLSPQARRLYMQSAERRLNAEVEQASRFRMQQQVVFETETSEARVTSAIQDAMLGWQDEGRIATARATGLTEIAQMAERNGWGAEVVQAKMEMFTSAMHSSVAQMAMKDAPGWASQYLDKHKGEMLPEQWLKGKRAVEDEDIASAAQSVVDTVVSQGGSIQSQLAMVRGQFSGKMEDTVVTRLKQRWAEAAIGSSRASSKGTVQGLALWGKLVESPDALKGADLAQYIDVLGTTQYKDLVRRKQKLLEDVDGAETYSFQTDADLVKEVYRAYEVPVQIGKTTEEEDLKKRVRIRSQFEAALNEQAQAKGRKLTAAEKRAVTDELTKEVTFSVKGMLWDSNTNKRALEVTMDDVKSAVPKAERDKIIEGYVARGITPTPAQIIEIYNRKSAK